MTSESPIGQIIGAIYEAALGEQGWEPALELIRASTGTRQACLIISDNRAAQPVVNTSASDDMRWSERLARLYNDEFYQDDPTCDAVGRLRVGDWFQDAQALTLRQREASRFHQEFLRPNGLSTWSSLLIQQDSVMTLLSLQWEEPRSITRNSLQSVEGLLPHFQRGIRFYKNFAAMRERLSLAEAAIDGLSTPIFVLGEAGCVLLKNKAADQLSAAEAAFKISKGFLVVPASRGKRGWDEAVLKGGYLVQRAKCPPLAVTLIPVPAHSSLASAWQKPVTLLIVGGFSSSIDSSRMLSAVFGLTIAEARVCVLLTKDQMSADECAVRIGVAVSTVRSQIKSIFGKTGVTRQSELVRLTSTFF